MLNYKNLQKVICYLNNYKLKDLLIIDVEYEYDEDEDQDIVIVECRHHKKNSFRLKIFNDENKYEVYISYIPGNNIKFHRVLEKKFTSWDSSIGGYLLFDSDGTSGSASASASDFIDVLKNKLQEICEQHV